MLRNGCSIIPYTGINLFSRLVNINNHKNEIANAYETAIDQELNSKEYCKLLAN